MHGGTNITTTTIITGRLETLDCSRHHRNTIPEEGAVAKVTIVSGPVEDLVDARPLGARGVRAADEQLVLLREAGWPRFLPVFGIYW